MRKVNYVFKFYDLETQTFYTLKNDIDEWQSFGISYGRRLEKSINMVKSYSASFTFLKEDAAWLRDILFTRGFNVRIAIYVYSADMFGTLTTQYRGFLDLTNAEISGGQLKCPIYEGGFFQVLDNKQGTKMNFTPAPAVSVEGSNLFEDILFQGGKYHTKNILSVHDGVGNTMVSVTTDNSKVSFLPLIARNTSITNYFQTPTAAIVDVFTANVVKYENMFIRCGGKYNGGYLSLYNRQSSIGDLELTIPHQIIDSGGIFEPDFMGNLTSGLRVNLKISIELLLYNRSKVDGWTYTANLLTGGSAIELHSSEKIYYNVEWKQADNGTDWLITIKNVTIADSTPFDFSVYLQQYLNDGYDVAMDMRVEADVMYKETTLATYDYKSGDWLGNMYFNDNFKVIYESGDFILNRQRYITGVKPNLLFRDIILRLNESVFNIDVNTELLENKTSGHYIVPSVGLRGTKNDIYDNRMILCVHTSLDDFLKTMYIIYGLLLNIRYDINTNKYYLYFSDVEDANNTKIDTIINIANLTITPDVENIYSKIVVGYENEDTAMMGCNEYNAKLTFSTSNTQCEEKELQLISPYRAGVFDIETFIANNNQNFADKKNDNANIYLLETELKETVVQAYGERRQGNVNQSYTYISLANKLYSINEPEIKESFNIAFTPKRILSRHGRELASKNYFNTKLKFINSSADFNFTFGGYEEHSDYEEIHTAITKPFIATIEVPAVTDLIPKIEANPLGYFEFTHNDKIYKGYIAEGTESLTINPMNEQASTLRLLLKNDSDL